MPMEKISSFSDYDLHATHSSDHITPNGSVYAGNFKISSSDQNFGERFSRKNSSKRHSSCPIDFMESVDHIIEPADYMKVSQFTLDYIEVEGSYKPRFGGYQTLVEREHSFYARNSTVHCGFIKGPSGFPSTGFNLNKKDKDYLNSCKVAVSSCIFGSSDFLRRPTRNVPEGSFIVRAHTPMSNLFSCLWFNEVDRFTSRDQLSFGYTFLKFRRMNPQKEFLLHMFKDCERRKVAKLFHHRGESPPIPHPQLSISERRSKLYERMSRDLEEHGAAFLEGGETSQSLSLSDLFSLKNGVVTPTLKPANPPVRANVLYLGSNYAAPLSQAVRDVFLPYFDGGIWFQNTSVYHFSMFHASHHLNPVPASRVEIEAEAKAVKGLTKELCPLKILLDRVVLTSTGVLLGCWQVMSGSDPSIIREKLERVLPLAPTKQLYDPVLLHTSFARLLGPPKTPTQAQVSELWYVEEMDILALALNGRMLVHRFDLGRCSRSLS